ncbi:MAG: toll/interleukin-1 receptor domain-containing protein [Pseudomonadota bacterium]
MQDENIKPRVFISYSHDSPEHSERVLQLSERLREDGVKTSLDQYVQGTPNEKWPRWMQNQLDWADFVLLICTETYFRRFRGHEEPGKGKGVDWEGAVIIQEIYDTRSTTVKFVAVIFDANAECFIPEPVRGHTFYFLDSEQAYQDLYDFLLGQAGVEPGVVGAPLRKPRKQAEPLAFPDESSEPRQPARQSAILQDPIDTLDERGFHFRLKKELTKSLSNEKMRPLISELTGDPDQVTAESAVNALLAMEPRASLRHWTEITATWFKDLNPRERSAVWDSVRDVHLNLLPRLVHPDWIKNWQENGHNTHDRRLLTVSLKQRSPNRSVEVLVARVDAKCGAVRFYETDKATTVQAHTGQINTANEALRGMQKPTSHEAVQRLGLYLMAQYMPDREPPDVLQVEDWEDLNDYIVERPAGLFHYYYLVIPEDDPDYGNITTLQLLYEKMPNLPRVLLSSKSGINPLICRQNRLEAVIDAFWDIRRMEFA